VPVRASIANLPEQEQDDEDVRPHSVCDEEGSGKVDHLEATPPKSERKKLWADHVIEHAAHFPAHRHSH
jgi:hypothetical protein